MHPLAVGGIAALVLGLVAAAVALVRLGVHGVPLGPVLLLNGLPLLIFAGGVVLSVWLSRRSRTRAGSYVLWGATALAAAVWWLLGG
ncbi:hypothetical protein [Caldinitratiruptor microaerophilus]|uniref:Transmembrane protein n=1 Tax=Caldinitratiruptor microaerophilus TaxID=671077 RepID=A0AA35CHR4_9FIRM|nr:hypothetical protein [Caldinitratiruptor microaerophilus]BDG59122.1 hypothetical protein caldi_02120 [Caldinitratiruptor microaerophilus]